MKIGLNHVAVGVLAVLFLAGALVFGEWQRLVVALGMLAVYGGVEFGIAYVKKQRWQLSAYAASVVLVLGLIFDIRSHPFLALLAAGIAAGSAHGLRFMNPAAFAIVFISLFQPVAAWWGVNWGLVPLLIIFVGGGYVLARERAFPETASFILVFAVLLLIFGMKPQLVFLDGAVWFFALFMLAESGATSPLVSKQRVWRGALVAALAALLTVMPRFWPLRDMDALLLALVIGNVIMGSRFFKNSRVGAPA